MALNFAMANDLNLSAGMKMLVYAPSGVGKTVLSATLPTPILLSAESGTLSLSKGNLERLFGVGNPTITYNMPLIQIRTIEDLTDAYQWLVCSHEAKAFQSVGMDSISEIAEVVLSNAKLQVKDPRQAYGELIEKMTATIRKFRDLEGKHVYLASKMGKDKDEVSGITKYMPDMPGNKLGQALPYFPDFVFRLNMGKTPEGLSYRYLQTQPDLQSDAKDRSGALAPMEYPHLGAIIEKVYLASQGQQIQPQQIQSA